jgi:hypothetical protein
MAESVYIKWNAVNWITIVLMASLGAVIIGVVVGGISTYRAKNNG